MRTLIVEVREAKSHQPASDVTVVADVPARDHPLSVASLLGQTGPLSSRASTDVRGVAMVRFVPGRPLRLGVLAPGWTTGLVIVEPDAPGFDPSAWLIGEPPREGLRTPEYRIKP